MGFLTMSSLESLKVLLWDPCPLRVCHNYSKGPDQELFRPLLLMVEILHGFIYNNLRNKW